MIYSYWVLGQECKHVQSYCGLPLRWLWTCACLSISSCQACEPGQVVFAERPLLVALPGGILGWDMVGYSGSKFKCKAWAVFSSRCLCAPTFSSLCPMPAVAPKLWECLQKLHEAIPALSVIFFWFRGRFALFCSGATSQPGHHYFPLCGSGLCAHAGAWQVLDLNTDCDFRVKINTITDDNKDS